MKRPDLDPEHELFFRHSFDLLAVVGSDGYFKRVNPAFERVLGYSQEELYAQPLSHFMHPEDHAKTARGIQRLTSGESTIESVNRYRRKDGVYRWISWNTRPQGTLFYSVGRDITEQVDAEERIRQLNAELARKNDDLERKIQERVSELQRSEAQVQQLQKMDAIGRLAGGIAHDFNNMLGAISLYCDLLADEIDPDSVKENVENIRKVGERAAALTRQLLVFSRKQIVQLQTVHLNPLIQQLEKMLVRLIGEDIRIVTRFAADLRAISADPSQLEQVLLNLVVNARDAMIKGGTITIETSNVYLDEAFSSTHLSVRRGHYVMLAVSDNGAGMDAATVSRIFEPFFTTKPVGKGTGLGLTTTYGIVKQLQGTIWVYSEPGQGTVFKIYLPVAEKAIAESKPEGSLPTAVVGDRTILLVEDDEKLRAGFALMLQKKGYQVLTAATGTEAIEIGTHRKGPIHLLLTDVVMPGLGGFDLAKKLRTSRADLRVIYMSGYTNDALENAGVGSTGHLDFLQKPFSTTALLAKVHEVLSRS